MEMLQTSDVQSLLYSGKPHLLFFFFSVHEYGRTSVKAARLKYMLQNPLPYVNINIVERI